MSLLSVIRRASALVGVPQPASAGSGNAQIVELARIDAEELAARYDWPELMRERSFVTVADVTQTGALPDDFKRFPFQFELRNTTQDRTIGGPVGTAEWARYSSIDLGLYGNVFRIWGGELQITPDPVAGETVTFPYITSKIFSDQSGVAKATWDVDSDVSLIPEEVIALGVVWRWKQAKGFDYGEDLKTAERQIERVASMSGGGPSTIYFGRQRLSSDLPLAYPGVLG